MINHRNKQNYRFRTWKIRDRCHLKGGVRQGCFQSLILNYLIQYIHFHSLYITSHYHAKFKENPCVGTDARPPFHLGRYIVVYTFGNHVLQLRLRIVVKLNFRPYISDNIPLPRPNENFEYSYPLSVL